MSISFDMVSVKSHCQVLVNIVHVGVGPISHSDVDLAHACGAYIVGFNVRSPPSSVTLAAKRANLKVIRSHTFCPFSFFSLSCVIYSFSYHSSWV